LGPETRIIDSASAVAQDVHAFLHGRGLARGGTAKGTLSLTVTDVPKTFALVARRFLGEETHDVEQVDL
jgi:glutamate racemase